jgi:hypothetical protein
MRLGHALGTLLLAFFCGASAFAGTYRTVDVGLYGWHDPSAWQNMVMPPDVQAPDDTIIINCDVVLMTSLGFRGTVIVNGVLSFYATDSGVKSKLVNYTKLIVNGDLIIYYDDVNLDRNNENQLQNDGDLEINGTLENVGAEVVNNDDVTLNDGGTIKNYALTGENNRSYVKLGDGSVINPSQHFAQLNDAHSSDGMNIDLGSDDVFGADENWLCLYGDFQNNGDILNYGGIYDKEECDGGNFRGNPIIDVSVCGAPQNLSTSGTLSSGLGLSWDAVEGVEGYYLGLKQAGSATWRIIIPLGANVTSYSFAPGFFPSGISVEWAVLAVCEAGVIDLSNLSLFDAELNRSGSFAEYDDRSIRVFPNPSNEKIQIASVGVNGQVDVDLFDMAGRLVISTQAEISDDRFMEIQTSSLQSGLYVLSIKDGSETMKEVITISH